MSGDQIIIKRFKDFSPDFNSFLFVLFLRRFSGMQFNVVIQKRLNVSES